ncbi:MAG: Dehydrogenase [Saliniramus fredricksonii]|uniref:Dehydrogenase n=1 Tax=Saliniramus fredricksonii TaxID=1653334 RepID=A0A0P8A3K1_9HYPH|nr:SDR family NAD(P)-dependent oxidoreductase [Saliniramus fredricksonii]KPQ12027.1 MAG: Dehydrogenase [Saliniramus fredricksonii]SCC81478.1 NAD(P)-dependent dehydrogenase, short-chain alcohol dehydrogenase family [Saliniramus fredricksonii]
MLRLTDRIALVTGAGSSGPGFGNGKAIATIFARQGARIIGIDRDPAALEETGRLITQEGGSFTGHACDVTDEVSVTALFDLIARDFGRLDILVNNVGRSEPGGPVELTHAVWDEQMDVNLTSAFLTCKHALPMMEEQGGGAVVNVSSIAGLRYIGKPQVAYAAAKAALIQMTRTTAVIYADRGIRLNCVVPGLMDTPLVRRLAEKYAGGDYEGFAATRAKQVPMGRMGDSFDVAHAALFLASEEARYITGTEIVVDGGITAATR